jgi:hypothetical protein
MRALRVVAPSGVALPATSPGRPAYRDAAVVVVTGAAGSVIVAWLISHRSGPLVIAFAVMPLLVSLLLRPGTGFLLATAVAIAAPRTTSHVWLMPTLLAIGGLTSIDRWGLRPRKFDILFGAWIIWCLASWWFHPELAVTKKVFITGSIPLLAYAWVRLSLTPRFLRRFLWVVLAAGTLAAGTVWLELLRGRVIFSDPTQYQWGGAGGTIYRPGGVFGGAPAAAIALAMISLATLVLIRERVYVATTCHCVIWGAVAVTYSRAGWAGLGVGLTLSALLLPYRKFGRILYVCAVVVIAAFAFQQLILKSHVYQSGVARPTTVSERFVFLHLATPLATDSRAHFLFGRGFDAFESPGYHDLNLMNAEILLERGGPHNEYMRAILEQGLVGLALFGGLLAGGLVIGLRAARSLPRGSDHRLVVVGLVGAVAAFVVAGLFHDLAHNVPDLTIGVIMLAALLTVTSSSFGALPSFSPARLRREHLGPRVW